MYYVLANLTQPTLIKGLICFSALGSNGKREGKKNNPTTKEKTPQNQPKKNPNSTPVKLSPDLLPFLLYRDRFADIENKQVTHCNQAEI